MKKRLLLIFAVLCVAIFSYGQMPQFSGQSYEDWIYSNPGIELNADNILRNRIVLYKTSAGLDLTLTSPEFACSGGQTIDMTVTYILDQWQNSSFDMSKVALTVAVIDQDGVAVDSATYVPTSVGRTNYVNLSVTVPSGMASARLRFAAWKANVNSSGAIRQIDITSSSSVLWGDVNLDGEVSVGDINAIIEVIDGISDDAGLRERADVNRDGEVTVADINSVIAIILGD